MTDNVFTPRANISWRSSVQKALLKSDKLLEAYTFLYDNENPLWFCAYRFLEVIVLFIIAINLNDSSSVKDITSWANLLTMLQVEQVE